MNTARRIRPILSGLLSLCMTLSPLSRAFATNDAPTQPVPQATPKVSEPRATGVGLIVSGSLLGSVALHPATIGGFAWLSSGQFGDEGDTTADKGRIAFLVGAGGLLVAGVLLVSGVVLNQRYQAWKSRPAHEKLTRRRVMPSLGMHGRTHTVGLLGRF